MDDIPRMHKILEIIDECEDVKTFFLDAKIDAKPGQFVMVWLPRVDEKPFTLSYFSKKTAITVEKKGKFTEQLFKLKKGDMLGIRGPYGNGFELIENSLIVAGGLGIAPLAELIEQLKNPTVIMGARSKCRVMFENRLKKHNPNICTDDGSYCFKGFTTEKMEELMQTNKFKAVYTCGPEIMMKKVIELAEKNKIECYASLERFMKCGFGVCGQCACGNNLVCKDGPIFNSKQIKQMPEFGNTARLKTGEKATLKEYVEWRS